MTAAAGLTPAPDGAAVYLGVEREPAPVDDGRAAHRWKAYAPDPNRPTTVTSALERYRNGGHKRVEGWLLQGAVDTICTLAQAQRRAIGAAPACEIGVHHGRLFILLHLLTVPEHRSAAIDLFEGRQEENVDASGRGSLPTLLRNVRAHCGDPERICIVAENSLHLTPARIVEACGGQPGIFSIDGGHTAELTRNDLRLAHDTLRDGGFAILDDYFNPSWPGVSEGTCRFMDADNERLEPVAITSNKVILALGAPAAAMYRDALSQAYPHAKLTDIFGRPVLAYETPTLEQRAKRSRAWQRLRETAAGRALRRGRAAWRDLRSR